MGILHLLWISMKTRSRLPLNLPSSLLLARHQLAGLHCLGLRGLPRDGHLCISRSVGSVIGMEAMDGINWGHLPKKDWIHLASTRVLPRDGAIR